MSCRYRSPPPMAVVDGKKAVVEASADYDLPA